LWTRPVRKSSGSTAALDTQRLLAGVFRFFNSRVSKIIHDNTPHPYSETEANVDIVLIGYYNIVHHLKNADMTPELRDDLINFSFDSLQDVIREHKESSKNWIGSVHNLSVPFLACLKRLVRYHFYLCVLQIFII